MNIQETFDNEAEVYEQTSRAVNIYFDEALDAMVSSLNLKKGMKILYVCCGTGILTQKILDKYEGIEVVGVDFSNGMMQVAKNRLKNYNFSCFNANICDESEMDTLPYEFDMVVSSFGVHNVHGFENKERALKNIVKHLKVSGRYITCDILKGDTAKQENDWQLFQRDWLLKSYSKSETDEWMKLLDEEDDKETFKNNKKLLELAGLVNIEKIWSREFLAIWKGDKI